MTIKVITVNEMKYSEMKVEWGNFTMVQELDVWLKYGVVVLHDSGSKLLEWIEM